MCKPARMTPKENLYWDILTNERPVRLRFDDMDACVELVDDNLVEIGIAAPSNALFGYPAALAINAESEYRH